MPIPTGRQKYNEMKPGVGGLTGASAAKSAAPSHQINANSSIASMFLPPGHERNVIGEQQVPYLDSDLQFNAGLEKHGHVQATDSVITVDVPDSRAVAAANSHAALKGAETHNLHTRFVSPLSEQNLKNTISAIRYNETTGEVLCVFADTAGAASRALTEAARMKLHIPEEVQVCPLTHAQKTFVSSTQFVNVVHNFAKLVLGEHQETPPLDRESRADVASGPVKLSSRAEPRADPLHGASASHGSPVKDEKADQAKISPPPKLQHFARMTGPH